MQHDPASIANNLKNDTADHANQEPPRLVHDAQAELHDQKQAESRSVSNVASKRGYVIHLSAAEGTCCYGAVGRALEGTGVWHFGCDVKDKVGKLEKIRWGKMRDKS